MRNPIIWLILICTLLGCEKDKPFGPVYISKNDSTQNRAGQRLIVGCEGNFQLGNASIYEINLESGKVLGEMYLRANNERIGDVLQDIKHRNDTLFVVMNNSGLVRLLNDSTYEEIGLIEGLESPRYCLPVGNHLWITDLYSNSIYVYNLQTLSLAQSIATPNWTERLYHHENHVFISSIDEKRINKYSIQGDLIKSVKLDFEPTFFTKSNNGLYVSNGSFNNNEGQGVIVYLNFELVERTIAYFEQPISGIACSNNELFALANNEVLELDIQDLTINRELQIDIQTPYAVNLDSTRSELYIMDAKDYISAGEVIRIDLLGFRIIDKFSVGNIPQASIIAL